MCHIEGKKLGSARFNSELSDEERRSIENTIILCNNCHTIIDNNVETYTVSVLQQMKKDHESKEGDLFEISEHQLRKIMKNEQKIIQENIFSWKRTTDNSR